MLPRAQQVQGRAPSRCVPGAGLDAVGALSPGSPHNNPLKEAWRAPSPVEETEAQRKGMAWPGLTQTGAGCLGPQGRSSHPRDTEASWWGRRGFELECPVYHLGLCCLSWL